MFKSGLKATSIACLFALSAGCANLSKDSYFHDVTLSKEQVNIDLFKDAEDFKSRFQRIKDLQENTGKKKNGKKKDGNPLTEDEVFRMLDIPRNRFVSVPSKEVMPWLTGGAVPNPQTKKAIDYTIALTNRAKIYTIQSKSTVSRGALQNAAEAVGTTSGHDMQMIFAFMDGKLFRAELAGTATINGKTIKFATETIGTVAAGAALGGGAALVFK